MDYNCDECYEMRQPHTRQCPKCGKNTYVGQIEGISCVWECTACGYGVISAGGFPPACSGTKQYHIIIFRPDDQKKMVSLARILNVNVLDLKKEFDEAEAGIERQFKILECAEKYKSIQSIGIECSLDADLLKDFPRILDCKYN